MKDKITLKELKVVLEKLWTKIETINKRTKTIYVYLRDFEKRIKKLEEK